MRFVLRVQPLYILLSLHETKELFQFQDKDLWERNVLEHIVVFIVRNDESGVSCKGAIHKLIVIVVFLNQMKAEIGIDQFHELTLQKQVNDICGNLNRHLLSNDLCIFLQNVC